MNRSAVISAILVLSLTFAGCADTPHSASDPVIAQKSGEFEEIYNLLELYSNQTGRPPTSVKDLAPLGNAYPAGFEQLRSERVVVVWGGKPDAKATGVLAYDKKTPTEGGWVLLQNGAVKKMTADEFRAAPKAN